MDFVTKRHRRGPSLPDVPCSDLVTALSHGWAGVEEVGGNWLQAGVQAGQTGLPLDTFPSIPHGLPGNG